MVDREFKRCIASTTVPSENQLLRHHAYIRNKNPPVSNVFNNNFIPLISIILYNLTTKVSINVNALKTTKIYNI